MLFWGNDHSSFVLISVRLRWSSDEANMQMKGPPYGSIRHCLSATRETMNSRLCFQYEFYLAGCFRNNVWLCVSKWDSHRYNVARQCARVGWEASEGEVARNRGIYLTEILPCTLNYCDKIIIRMLCDLNCFEHIH